MSEDQKSGQERTEQPTEKRKNDARKKGQIPRSKELNTMLSLLFGAFGLVIMGGPMSAEFISLFQSALVFDREVAFDSEMIAVRLVDLIISSLVILAPFFAVMIVGAVVGPIFMGGWLFSPSSMAFKLEKLNPGKGLKRVFSSKGLLELLKALFKFIILAVCTAILFSVFIDQILGLGSLIPSKAFVESVTILRWSLVVLSFTLIFIVVLDVPFVLWDHNKQLKMTLREVKDELKESDGRPEVKGRIRMLQREMSQRRMMEALPSADVVITNPTHYAVALKYAGAAGQAPMVLAKGCDLIALRIRSVAVENEIAIFEAPPLARALYSSTEIGEEIPEKLFLAVAKVLAYIYQLRKADFGEYVKPPGDISVPEEYSTVFSEGGLDGGE